MSYRMGPTRLFPKIQAFVDLCGSISSTSIECYNIWGIQAAPSRVLSRS